VDLEHQLRSVLTDERLDVHVAAGAVQTIHDGVRRRRRRNAAMSAAASFVLVIGGISSAVLLTQGNGATLRPQPDQQGNSTSPPPGGVVKPPARAAATVPWHAVAYDPGKPFVLPGTTPSASTPSCKAGQLSMTASEFQGATGSAVGALVVTNNGSPCGLQGRPVLTGYGDGDTVVATTAADDPFLVHPWFALQHGEQARTTVQIFGDTARCSLGAVRRLTVDLGQGDGSLSADLAGAGGDDVMPRCGTVPKEQQVDHYTTSPGEWTRRDGTPRLPMANFTAAIGQQPAAVMQGTTVRYQVLLSTGGADVDPCLPFRQQLVSLDGSQSVYGTSYFLMDCTTINDNPAQSYTLDVQLRLPKDIPVGSYALQWQTPIPSLSASDGQMIQVTSSPPKCTGAQLSVTSGGLQGASGAYYGRIIFTNISPDVCSLRGYPGVQFADGEGKRLPTVARDPDGQAINSAQERTYSTVTLRAHGGTASFLVSGSDWIPPAGATQCPASKGLFVIQPGGYLSDQKLVSGVAEDCQREHIRVWPVVAGSHAMAN